MIEDPFLTTDQFIRARQYDPKDFEKESYKTIRLGSGVKAVIGKMLGDNHITTQSVLFNKERFDETSARQWLNRNLDKLKDAIELENQKVGLFQHDMTYEEHLQGHLPPLTHTQINRLLELAGPDSESIDSEHEEDDMSGHEDEEDEMANRMYKYFRRIN